MMLFYLFLLFALVLARLLVLARAVRYERKYSRLAREARELAGQPVYKQGNSSRPDAYLHAKQQYLLGEVTAKRDQAEARYETWQARADRLGQLLTRLRGWKGRTVPYLLGVSDVVLLLVSLATLGLLEFPALSQLLTTLFN